MSNLRRDEFANSDIREKRTRAKAIAERFQPSRSSCVRVAAINANVYYERRPAMECRRSGTKHLDREPPTIRLARWIAERIAPESLLELSRSKKAGVYSKNGGSS